ARRASCGSLFVNRKTVLRCFPSLANRFCNFRGDRHHLKRIHLSPRADLSCEVNCSPAARTFLSGFLCQISSDRWWSLPPPLGIVLSSLLVAAPQERLRAAQRGSPGALPEAAPSARRLQPGGILEFLDVPRFRSRNAT